MSSLFDYGRPHHHHHQEGQEQQQQEHQNHQQQRDDGPFSPRSDSATRALHDSTFDSPVSPSNGLTSSSGMNGIKSEPSDAGNDLAGAQPDHQNDLRRQSAASALLAQLLGNQSSAPPAGTETQPAESSSSTNNPPNPTESSQNNPSEQIAGGQGSTNVSTEISAPAESAAGRDQFSASTDLPRLPGDGEKNREDRPADMSFPKSEESGNHGVDAVMKTPDPAEGLTDPMMFSKTGLNDSDLFTPFDIASAGKNPFDNEMLTSAYLSQSADLSALGYSAGHLQDGTGSLGGSEPRIQAFAKLEFDDGHFYCNTYSFILGRDVRAARAAHQREFQARQAIRTSRAKSSSGGNASHTPVRVKHEGSGMIGSVVSDRGGIMGLDPDIPAHLPKRLSRRSSHSSEAGAPLHATPAQLQSTTDYNALAMQSLHEANGDAKPVDALALLPSPDACPTIPIHPPATLDGSAAGHRGISRKHVKIAYNFDKNLFEMEVMGRNGAFIGADWLSPGQVRPLHSGDYIQIGGVRIRFLLPDVPIGETGADRVEEPSIEENGDAKASAGAEYDAEGAVEKGEGAENKDSFKPTKLVLKTKESDPSRPVPSIEGTGDGAQHPVRRRGPGRPPKDGIMSKRERAELAREQKLAAKREANGGVTPPPLNRPKAGKTTTSTTSTVGTAAATPSLPGEGESPGSKPEKRKYTKRKKPDGTLMDYPLPSTEGGPFPMEQRPEEFIKAPPVKKRKPSRSPSPNYPPESAYTPEDLAKPPYNYAVLIFDALTEAGTPMTLKQIYRALKLKYPYFRFKCETEGWTSSVRHNLNGNSHLFMHAERDGKGWSWQLRPGASVEKEKKRRPSPPPPSQPPSVPASAPQYMPPLNPSYGNPQNGQANLANQHFQFPTMPPNTYAPPTPAPASSATAPPSAPPRHQDPYPPPHPPPQAVPASAPFPIPSPLRNNLPPAFAQTTPSTYTSPYASDPPPQLAQFQQPQQPQQQPGMHSQSQHHSPYPPHNATAPPPPQQQQHMPPPPPGNPQQPQQYLPPNPGPPMQPPQQQQQPNYNVAPMNAGPTPMGDPESVSFEERASKAIDDFEAVLLEDYEDKNHIKEVLKSARARALGHATESSFPGGEPKDEAVILDALRTLIGGLRDQ
ncbi:forkhead domain protein [Aspergillus novofumigatus IBT 16806]|uniref:Forkhead domain protein n=1 Tax=Aspergillus novofumigatus (strain IBT 16806) TaxID=1392255 RepID=A0A2I1C325_ASPN1|nr:uncharacterized protein P174DRAFT_444037 [Aspergillus novofumigatus IBT 16806]PKX92022.1 hypothetical protein P174DRAFT_444037 [Aspergillus novofumigatus IBT 16806]